MESIVVEAIRQLPALVLAVLAIYFYRSAQRATELSHDTPAVPSELLQNVDGLCSRADQLESGLREMLASLEAHESATVEDEQEAEAMRAQLSNQKMALKEFGRVLSKTSEQTYTEFGAIDERLREIEKALAERGMLSDENRSAAA